MTDNPLGDINGTEADTKSIVDTIFNLDALMSADIRRAEKTARFSVQPQLEADIEELDGELQGLVDSEGRPLIGDGELASSSRVHAVLAELDAKQKEYAASMRSVRFRAMSDDDWTAFQAKHKETLAGDPPYTPEFYQELIADSSFSPKFTVADVKKFRQQFGAPAFEVLFRAAWMVNTVSGVSIPKSLISSAVQRQIKQG